MHIFGSGTGTKNYTFFWERQSHWYFTSLLIDTAQNITKHRQNEQSSLINNGHLDCNIFYEREIKQIIIFDLS